MTTPTIEDVTKRLAQTKVSPQNELSFKGQGLKLNKAEDAKHIIDEIEKCPHMTALCMEGNTLGVEAAEALAKALGKHPEFERALWSDMFTGRLKTEIPPALQHLGAAIISAGCHLVEIDLSDNAFGPRGVEGLVELLKSPSCYSLQELRLNNNGLGIGGGKLLSQCLLDCLESSAAAGHRLALRVFVSGRNRLENDGATALAAAFKAIGTLEELAMPQNGIYFEGISALADALAENKKLRVLNLNDNTFTEKGAQQMSKVLPKLQELEVINFGDCLLRTDGALALAKAIKSGQKKLKELILSGNEIKQSGGIAITEAVAEKNFLERLDLNANILGEDGVELVQNSMEVVGKLDALASLSDDEGCEDEDEGAEDGEEAYPGEEEDGEVVEDLQITGTAITPSKQGVRQEANKMFTNQEANKMFTNSLPHQCGDCLSSHWPFISGKEFLAFPSPTRLQQLGHNKSRELKDALGSDQNDPDKVVEAIMKVTLVVTGGDEKTKNCACECADGLLKQVFESVEDAASLVPNAFLVYLGLLKGEDKKYRAPSNITGPLLVLDHVVQQSYFPRTARDMLLCFLSKPHPQLEKASAARHQILQTLYAF